MAKEYDVEQLMNKQLRKHNALQAELKRNNYRCNFIDQKSLEMALARLSNQQQERLAASLVIIESFMDYATKIAKQRQHR